MSDDARDHLLAVADLDTLITQLVHKRAGSAERVGLAALEGELAALSAEESVLLEQRRALVAAQKELEAQIAATNERRTGIEQRMYAARGSSTRDLQAMDEEVRHLNQRRSELEEDELVAMVDQEPIDGALAALAARRAPLEERAGVLRAEVAAGNAEIDGELARARAERAAQAVLLPAALSERYEALSARLKGTGAARLVGHRCSGCHLELSPVEVDRIRAAPSDTVVTCDQCGRILVPA
jgi:hypothetical protein